MSKDISEMFAQLFGAAASGGVGGGAGAVALAVDLRIGDDEAAGRRPMRWRRRARRAMARAGASTARASSRCGPSARRRGPAHLRRARRGGAADIDAAWRVADRLCAVLFGGVRYDPELVAVLRRLDRARWRAVAAGTPAAGDTVAA